MKNIKFTEYLIQIIIVIFGVFLGMLLSEWNSDRKDDNQQKAILSHIIKEIQVHQNQLAQVIPYHKSMSSTIDSILTNSNQEELTASFIWNGAWGKIPKWQGTKLFPLHTSAYESAKISNVLSGLDSELLEPITGYYESVHYYNTFCNGISQKLFEINSQTQYVDALLLIRIMKEDLLGTEKDINALSESLIQTIELGL